MNRTSFINGKTSIIKKMNEHGARREPFLFIVDYLAENAILLTSTEQDTKNILYSIQGRNNIPNSMPQFKKPVIKEIFPTDFENYKRQFEHIQSEIRAGNSYLANLTCATPISLDGMLTSVFLSARAKYKLLVEDSFVVFSPETFVTIQDGMISSHPMKGTIDASIPGAREIILNDMKETAEHYTIVDLIRNDLSMVAKNVRVNRFRYIEEVRSPERNLFQVSSEITGRLTDDYHHQLGEILVPLLPPGSVTGAPKKKTVEILDAVESYRRGFYCGVFGYFDGNNLDSAVSIRFIEKTADGYLYKSGGGITMYSNAESEYQEMLDKIYVPVT